MLIEKLNFFLHKYKVNLRVITPFNISNADFYGIKK